MVEANREAWHEILAKCNDTGADGYELNFGCPHGMSERGMGAAVGQVPEYCQMITEWVMEKAELPVLVKLTPNITDIRYPARAAKAARADGIALINTISSLIGVNLDTWAPIPDVRGRGSHGGYAGPAVKPIALNMVSQVAADPEVGLPVSGIGGIETWRDAVDFLLLGATNVQVGTSVMHYGFRLIDDLVDGLSTYLRAKGLHSPSQLVGQALPQIGDWGQLDQEFRLLAHVDQERCIHCNLCYAACTDGAHQAMTIEGTNGTSRIAVDADYCVGCRLCQYVCPVDELHHVRGARGRRGDPLIDPRERSRPAPDPGAGRFARTHGARHPPCQRWAGALERQWHPPIRGGNGRIDAPRESAALGHRLVSRELTGRVTRRASTGREPWNGTSSRPAPSRLVAVTRRVSWPPGDTSPNRGQTTAQILAGLGQCVSSGRGDAPMRAGPDHRRDRTGRSDGGSDMNIANDARRLATIGTFFIVAGWVFLIYAVVAGVFWWIDLAQRPAFNFLEALAISAAAIGVPIFAALIVAGFGYFLRLFALYVGSRAA